MSTTGESALRRYGAAATLGAAGLAVGVLSSLERARSADWTVFRAINSGHGRGSDLFFLGITELGSLYASGAAAATLAARGHRSAAFRAIEGALLMWGAGQALKQTFLRKRPFQALPDQVRQMIARPQGTSWPSAHPATLMAFVTVAGRELGLGRAARAGLAGVAGAVGCSRVYLGVHYPSDVVGGLLLGRAIGLAWSRERRDAPLR